MYATPSPISSGSMREGDRSITLTIDPQIVAGGLESLFGATCVLVVVYQGSPSTRQVLPLSIAPDQKTLTRVTLASDFPRAGAYLVQVVITIGSAQYSSGQYPLDVGSRG